MTTIAKMTPEDTELESGTTAEADGSSETPAPGAEAKDAVAAAPAAVIPKKPLGTKEVIPFEWKLVGHTAGMAVTLFKAVDRQDVEVQYERILKDGYYKDLKILDINAKVVQPKKPRNSKPSAQPKKAAPAADAEKTKRSRKPAARSTKTAPAAKIAKKAKTTGKKTAKTKAPARRTAKKK